jgi:hypothetical protein
MLKISIEGNIGIIKTGAPHSTFRCIIVVHLRDLLRTPKKKRVL